jgi:hypothetical protein
MLKLFWANDESAPKANNIKVEHIFFIIKVFAFTIN